MSTVAERPILFSGAMVRAILAGQKSQARRIHGLGDVNAYPGALEGEGKMGPLGYRGLSPNDYYIRDKKAYAREPERWHWFLGEQEREVNPIPVKCPYGAPGDRLWVRETWGVVHEHRDSVVERGALNDAKDGMPWASIAYRADTLSAYESDHLYRWRPSIHMPRWASRRLLQVTEVRVERLQDISEEDAIAEGCPGLNWSRHPQLGPCTDGGELPSEEFARLWDSINGKKAPWDSNPWVWAISFPALAGTPGQAPAQDPGNPEHVASIQLSPEGRGVPLVRPGELKPPCASRELARAGSDPGGEA